MNLGRIFANAFARRVAYLVVAFLLAGLGIGTARAEYCGVPHVHEADDVAGGHVVYQYEGQAMAACQTAPAIVVWNQSGLNNRMSFTGCTPVGGTNKTFRANYTGTGTNFGTNCDIRQNGHSGPISTTGWQWVNPGCPPGEVPQPDGTCAEDCSARADRNWNPGQVGILNGSTTCDNGCRGIIHKNPSAAGYVVTYAGGGQCEAPPFPEGCSAEQRALGWRNSTIVAGVCVPPTQSCPDGTARDPETGDCGEDACPAGMSLNPQGQCEPQDETCPAGQTRAPDGSCQNDQDNCPAGQVKGPDGTCKPDGNGDGEPDDEVPDSFSGGDSCEAPPSCSGDVIMCGIARINWRIDCNTRKDTKVNGGACNAIPVCVGRNCDALEYAQLLQQWRASCALERLAEDGIGGGDGGEDGEDGPQSCGPGKTDAECEAGQNIGDTGDAGSVMVENEWLASGFDTAGFGWSQSCPAIPSVTVFSTTIDFQSKLGPLCEWVQLGGIFLMITTAITCLVLLIKV